jgi:hypothetical protein
VGISGQIAISIEKYATWPEPGKHSEERVFGDMDGIVCLILRNDLGAPAVATLDLERENVVPTGR